MSRRMMGSGRGRWLELSALPSHAAQILRPSLAHTNQLNVIRELYPSSFSPVLSKPNPFFKSAPSRLSCGSSSDKVSMAASVVLEESKWPYCSVGMWLPAVTASLEREGEEGFSLAFARLSQTCTRRRMPAEWSGLWSSMATSLTVLPSRDGLFIGCLVAPSFLENALRGLLEIVCHPSIDLLNADQLMEVNEIEKRQMVELSPDLFLQELSYIQMFGGKGLGNSPFSSSSFSSSGKSYEEFCRRIREGMVFGVSGPSSALEQVRETIEEAQEIISSKSVPEICLGSIGGGPLYIQDSSFGNSIALESANRWIGKTHFMIALPTAPSFDVEASMIPQALVASLLGGGSSFSAGGPGKGLYSRLYTDLLNRYAWIEDAHCFFQSHLLGGWLGIYVSCDRQWAEEALDAAIVQLSRLHLTTDEAFQRAKNRLKSILLMGVESRLSLLEAQLRAASHRIKTKDENFKGIPTLIREIDSMRIEDLSAFRNRLVGDSRLLPTLVAASEDLSSFPSFSDALGMLEHRRHTLPARR